MDDKKRLIVLLTLLGVALIGGGVYFFMSMSSDEIDSAVADVPIFSKVDSIKNLANKNIIYLNSSSSLINSFYQDKRYLNLKDNFVEVEIFGTGNPEPFAPLLFGTSTEEESEQ